MTLPPGPPQGRRTYPATGFWRPGPLLIAAAISTMFGCCGCVILSCVPGAIFIVPPIQLALLIITIFKLREMNAQEQTYHIIIEGKHLAWIALGLDIFALVVGILGVIAVVYGISYAGGNS